MTLRTSDEREIPSLDSNNKNLSFSFLEQNIIFSILGDTCKKLDVLQYLLPCWSIKWERKCPDLETRFKVEKLVVLPEEIPSEKELQLTKIQQCRYFLKTLFQQTIEDIFTRSSLENLNSFILCEQKFYFDEVMIRNEHKNLKDEIISLKLEIKELKSKTEDEILYLTETLSRDQEQALINAWVEQQVAESYVDNRETAKVAQVKLKIKGSEDDLNFNLDDDNITKDMELRINQEIETFLLTSIAELQEKLYEWTNRYNTEIEERDVELLQLKNLQEEQRENMNTTLEMFTARREEMQILKELADERDREQELKTKQNRAALMIQKWWRNFLFLYRLDKSFKKKMNKKKKK